MIIQNTFWCLVIRQIAQMSLCISPEGMTYLTLCIKISDFIPQGESCVAKGKSFSQRRKAAKKMRFMAYGQ